MTRSADSSSVIEKTRGDNRRKHARVKAQNCASIQAQGAKRPAMGVLNDISADGLAMQTEQPPQKGDEVTVNVLVHGAIHPVIAQVAHVTKMADGLYLVGLHAGLLVLQGQGLVARALGLDSN